MAPKSVRSKRVWLLPLADDGSPDIPGGYIYLPAPGAEPYTLRFTIDGASSICREGSLWVNFPESGKQFSRHQYREFKFVVPTLGGSIV